MAEEDLISYKDISELKNELDGMREKKDISPKDLNDAMHRLADTMAGMLEVFGAAAEQMNLEEKENESEFKKHEILVSRLDKLLDQNKTIAEGMVAIVEMFKEKFPQGEKEEPTFKVDARETMYTPKDEPKMFTSQSKPEWKPAPAMQKPQPQPMPQMNAPLPQMPPSPMPGQNFSLASDFGMQMPPMEPTPMPDFDFPEGPFSSNDDQAQKKKGLFGMFKK